MKTTTRTELQSRTVRVWTDSPTITQYRAIQGNDLMGYDLSPWTKDLAQAEGALAEMVTDIAYTGPRHYGCQVCQTRLVCERHMAVQTGPSNRCPNPRDCGDLSCAGDCPLERSSGEP
jgi:hypothetical protein